MTWLYFLIIAVISYVVAIVNLGTATLRQNNASSIVIIHCLCMIGSVVGSLGAIVFGIIKLVEIFA